MRHQPHTLIQACVLSVALLVGPSTSFAAKKANLNTWFDKELTPYVSQQLTSHPRFKGELVRFVVFKNGSPAPTSDELAVSLRDHLADAVIDVPGVRVGWSFASRSTKAEQTAIDCSKDAVHYYIGLEISETKNGQYKADLRALDLEDRSWVAGFARTWQGKLSRSEQHAFHRSATDQSFKGQRAVPFSDDQPDLLAALLAHDLGCALLRQVSGEYLVALEGNKEPAVPMEDVVELVSNNLAAYRALQVTPHKELANAVLKGKAHHVDDDLYQYWITVAPTEPSSDLPPVSASAYIHLPGLYASQRRQGLHNTNERIEPIQSQPPPRFASNAPGPVTQSDADVLSSIRIVELRSSQACSAGSVSFQRQIQRGSSLQDWFDDCFALQVRTKEDAVVFFLNHQVNNGLVRLSGRDCSQRTEARIARANEPLEYALPLLSLTENALSNTSDWPVNPDADVYYAIAVSDDKAARALSSQLGRLPRRCSISVRPGLEGVQLENWMAEFAATIDRWQPHVDWQAIRVRNVF
jgi:hypothetical protein